MIDWLIIIYSRVSNITALFMKITKLQVINYVGGTVAFQRSFSYITIVLAIMNYLFNQFNINMYIVVLALVLLIFFVLFVHASVLDKLR
jgi:hypothetical protein